MSNSPQVTQTNICSQNQLVQGNECKVKGAFDGVHIHH